MRRLAKVCGVEVTGEVADIQAEFERFTVSTAPMLIARGLQNKVLEAMAAAKPVVLTSGAAEGIDAEDGRHFVVADRPDQMADAIVRLLQDSAERDAIGRTARQFVAQHHRWDAALSAFELIVTGVGERRTDRVNVRPTAQPLRAPATPRTHADLSRR